MTETAKPIDEDGTFIDKWEITAIESKPKIIETLASTIGTIIYVCGVMVYASIIASFILSHVCVNHWLLFGIARVLLPLAIALYETCLYAKVVIASTQTTRIQITRSRYIAFTVASIFFICIGEFLMAEHKHISLIARDIAAIALIRAYSDMPNMRDNATLRAADTSEFVMVVRAYCIVILCCGVILPFVIPGNYFVILFCIIHFSVACGIFSTSVRLRASLGWCILYTVGAIFNFITTLVVVIESLHTVELLTPIAWLTSVHSTLLIYYPIVRVAMRNQPDGSKV